MTINIKDDEVKQNADCDNVKEMRDDLFDERVRKEIKNIWINMFLESLNSKLTIICLFYLIYYRVEL